jgi:hypothetical protein
MFNTYFFSTLNVVTQRRLNVTFVRITCIWLKLSYKYSVFQKYIVIYCPIKENFILYRIPSIAFMIHFLARGRNSFLVWFWHVCEERGCRLDSRCVISHSYSGRSFVVLSDVFRQIMEQYEYSGPLTYELNSSARAGRKSRQFFP